MWARMIIDGETGNQGPSIWEDLLIEGLGNDGAGQRIGNFIGNKVWCMK